MLGLCPLQVSSVDNYQQSLDRLHSWVDNADLADRLENCSIASGIPPSSPSQTALASELQAPIE